MGEMSLAEAIAAFERRVKVSPTLRDSLRFPEYLELIRAVIREKDTVLKLRAELERMTSGG